MDVHRTCGIVKAGREAELTHCKRMISGKNSPI